MSRPEQKTALNIVLGCMTFGAEGTEARVHEVTDVAAILDVFQVHGHSELDCARTYAAGTTEEILGDVGWRERGLAMDTKLYPTAASGRQLGPGGASISHGPEDLRKHLDISLKALKTDSIELWYLHGPDRKTPYEVTLKAVDDLYREGKFKRFGLSNYMAWEVAEIVGICKSHGYVVPTVYQGIYNAIHRNVEPELFPCLRKFGIAFYGFNPLGGGFFTGRYRSIDDVAEPGSRFDPGIGRTNNYRNRYWNDAYFNALAAIEVVGQKHSLTMAEIALRWVSHHSLLRREHGDAIIVGASSVSHIEQNLADLEKGPLPDEVLKVLDETWASVKLFASKYYH